MPSREVFTKTACAGVTLRVTLPIKNHPKLTLHETRLADSNLTAGGVIEMRGFICRTRYSHRAIEVTTKSCRCANKACEGTEHCHGG